MTTMILIKEDAMVKPDWLIIIITTTMTLKTISKEDARVKPN